MSNTKGDSAFDEWRQAWLEDAAVELDRAIRVLPDLHPVYRLIRARALYGANKFREAGALYEYLSKNMEDGFPEGRKGAHRSAVLSYKRAGALDEAKKLLTAELKSSPNTKGIRLELAEIEAQAGGSYDRVPALLREEMELNPSADADWKLSTILALGETQENWEALKREFRNQTNLNSGIEKVVSNYWTTLGNLTQPAREEWLTSVWLSSFTSSEGGLGRSALRNAALCCIGAVEIELRERLIVPFRSTARTDASLLGLAEAHSNDDQLELLARYVKYQSTLTFGQIVQSIQMAVNRNDPLSSALYRFARNVTPVVLEKTSRFEELNQFRKPAGHAGVGNDAEVIIQTCKQLLEKLARKPLVKAVAQQ